MFMVVTPCSSVEIHRHFGGTYDLHLRGRNRRQLFRLLIFDSYIYLLIDPEDGRNTFLRIIGGLLHGATTQKYKVLKPRRS
jgi:hypothetical protein